MTALWFPSPVNQSTKLEGHQGEMYIFYHSKLTTLKDQMVFLCPPRDTTGNSIPHKDVPTIDDKRRPQHFISYLTVSYHLLSQHPDNLEKNAFPAQQFAKLDV